MRGALRTAGKLWLAAGIARANSVLDALVRPHIHLGERAYPPYRVFVFVGVCMGLGMAACLSWRTGLELGVSLGVAALGVLVSVVASLATSVLTGRESYTFYHYQVLVAAGAAAALVLLDRPVLPYLEIILVALGFVLAWGRIGCFLGGCCHGRPHRLGARYGPGHVAMGFARDLCNARLFPVQLVESVLLFGIIGVAAARVVGGSPGEGLVVYLVGYGCLRFVLEYARGDPGRRQLLGLSEGQWSSLLFAVAAISGGALGLIPVAAWAVALTGLLLAAAIATIARRPLRPRLERDLARSEHLAELARAIDRLRASGDAIAVETTSLGIRLSGGEAVSEDGPVSHYSLSCSGPVLSPAAVRTLVRIVLRLRHPGADGQLRPGQDGVFHLLVPKLEATR